MKMPEGWNMLKEMSDNVYYHGINSEINISYEFKLLLDLTKKLADDLETIKDLPALTNPADFECDSLTKFKEWK